MELAALVAKAASLDGLSEEEKQTLLGLAQSPPDGEQLSALQKAVADAEQERDAARGELRSHLRRDRVAELASANGFGDRDYLDYLLLKHEIDPDDAERAAAFLGELKNTSPKLFTLRLHPGSGNPPVSRPGNPGDQRDLASMLADAPEVVR